MLTGDRVTVGPDCAIFRLFLIANCRDLLSRLRPCPVISEVKSHTYSAFIYILGYHP